MLCKKNLPIICTGLRFTSPNSIPISPGLLQMYIENSWAFILLSLYTERME